MVQLEENWVISHCGLRIACHQILPKVTDLSLFDNINTESGVTLNFLYLNITVISALMLLKLKAVLVMLMVK